MTTVTPAGFNLNVRPLHPHFAVEVQDVDLRDITETHGYPALRQLFEQHSLLLFRDQRIDRPGGSAGHRVCAQATDIVLGE